MAYHMAWRIGWSFFWRRALWLAALAVCLVPLFTFSRHRTSPLFIETLAAGIVAIEAFVIHPFVVRALPRIHYRDFRLVVADRPNAPEDLTYREALLVSIGPTAIIVLCEALALSRGMVLPLLVVYPAVAWLLTYPWGRCRLEVVETLSPYGPAVF